MCVCSFNNAESCVSVPSVTVFILSYWLAFCTCQALITRHHFEASPHFTACTVVASASLPSATWLWSREVISCIDFKRKHPSCSSFFWNCSWTSLWIIVMTLLSVFSQKSVQGKPCLFWVVHPPVSLYVLKDVLSNINHTSKRWWILKSSHDQGYCPRVCVCCLGLPRAIS